MSADAQVTELADFAALCRWLRDQGVAHQVDPQQEIAALHLRHEARAAPLYVSWEQAGPRVRIAQPLVDAVPPDRMSAVERIVAILNRHAPEPGYCLVRDRASVFLRFSVEGAAGCVRVADVRRALGAAVVAEIEDGAVLRALARKEPVPPNAVA